MAVSPKLLETPCRTIDQLRLVNKFCQLAEFATGAEKGGSVIVFSGRGSAGGCEGVSRGSA
jgi:hypothetical protein